MWQEKQRGDLQPHGVCASVWNGGEGAGGDGERFSVTQLTAEC